MFIFNELHVVNRPFVTNFLIFKKLLAHYFLYLLGLSNKDHIMKNQGYDWRMQLVDNAISLLAVSYVRIGEGASFLSTTFSSPFKRIKINDRAKEVIANTFLKQGKLKATEKILHLLIAVLALTSL